MLKLLYPNSRGPSWITLRKIVENMEDVEIEYAADEDAVRTKLLQGDIDVYFDDYDSDRDRLKRVVEYIHAFGVETAVISLADPRNYAELYEDKTKSVNICLLKPVREERVRFALQNIADRKELRLYNQYVPTVHGLWNRVRRLVQENFWREMLIERMFPGGIFMTEAAQSVRVADIDTHPILPVLYYANESDKDWRYPNHKEIFESMTDALVICENSGYNYYLADGTDIILFQPYNASLSVNQIILRCFQYCEEMERQFGYHGICIVGEPVSAADLAKQWRELNKRAANLRFRKGRVFRLGDNEDTILYDPPALEQWTNEIVEGRKELACAEIKMFFERNRQSPDLTTDYIVSLSYELDRSVSIEMLHRGVFENQDQALIQLFFNCTESTEMFLLWIATLSDWCIAQSTRRKEAKSVLESACAYIKKNLSSDLRRQDIADYVHVSQNYLARLFRRDMNMTVAEYVLQERMLLAGKLLVKTRLPITNIAMDCGFASQSYFSSCFHEHFRCSPREYRQQNT